MRFIITRFLRMVIRDYGFEYTLIQQPDKSYLCTITKIPYDLKIALIRLKYDFVIGQKDIYDKSNTFVRTEAIVEKSAVCQGIYNPVTEVHGIRVIFNEDTYAVKVNKLDEALRRYYETHSLIDQINNKG